MPYVDESRKTTLELETRVNNENPDFIRDFREGDADLKDFIKDRFKLLKSHCRLDAIDMFSVWRSDLYNFQRESLEHHIAKLEEVTNWFGLCMPKVPNMQEKLTTFLDCDMYRTRP